MIGIYERSLCQSYASAYRAGIKIGEAETREDALKQVEAMTEDSLAWRILDAQFFGVAQRRRRLFLVGHLGACPPVGVLIEPESMRGDLESSAEKRASLAEEAGRSPRSAGFKYHQGASAGGVGAEPEQSPTLTADWHNPAVYPIDEPITMADLNANTAIGYDMVGTLKVGGDAPSVCL